jgi:hypothetical protein
MNTIKLNPELAKKYGVETLEDYGDMMIAYCEADNQTKIKEMADALSDDEAKALGSDLTTAFHYDIVNSDETEEQFLESLYLNRSPS